MHVYTMKTRWIVKKYIKCASNIYICRYTLLVCGLRAESIGDTDRIMGKLWYDKKWKAKTSFYLLLVVSVHTMVRMFLQNVERFMFFHNIHRSSLNAQTIPIGLLYYGISQHNLNEIIWWQFSGVFIVLTTSYKYAKN